MKKTYSNINPTKLHDELIAAGLSPMSVSSDIKENEYIAQNIWITFTEGTNMEAVQAIIDAHDPTPKPQPPSDIERIAALEDAILFLLGGF